MPEWPIDHEAARMAAFAPSYHIIATQAESEVRVLEQLPDPVHVSW